jgi:2'-5' RNA ligase
MHRLFVAIRPPRAIRDQLLDIMGSVAGARWQSDEQIHITLRFVGEVDRHRAEDLHAALCDVHQAGFEVALNGLGVFERRGEAVTLWAGIKPHDPLKALHKKVDQACLRAGVEPDHRAYMPHITLARLRGAGSMQPLLEKWGGIASPLFPVRQFCLFESELTPSGPIYSLVERYSLG